MFGSLCYRAVELPNGIGQPWIAEQDYSRIATLYRQWLAGPGKDPAQWLPIAQRQARAYLESDNLDAAYCGATFLYAGRDERRDDDPDRTVARLGQIIDGAVKVTGGKPGAYQYQGKPLKDPINLWVELLTNYDARARPWSASLIRFREESNDWRSLEFLTRVGGREIMAYFFESFSKIKQAADPTIRDQAQVDCRSGIDRWAGRTFETDNQRLDWWKSNQDKSPEQWLRDSLLNTARRADIQLEKSEIARASPDAVLFRQLFPDAPYGIDETLPGFHYLNDSGINPLPFREKWFLEHQSEFIYDASAANFRLPKGKQG